MYLLPLPFEIQSDQPFEHLQYGDAIYLINQRDLEGYKNQIFAVLDSLDNDIHNHTLYCLQVDYSK